MTVRYRKCLDCPAISDQIRSGRCPDCARKYEKQRGTKRERGYGAEFDKAKRDPAYRAATHCTNCGVAFTEGNPKTAGHVVAIREGGGDQITPTCRRCNYGWRKTGL
jgi:hypothetical protein